MFNSELKGFFIIRKIVYLRNILYKECKGHRIYWGKIGNEWFING